MLVSWCAIMRLYLCTNQGIAAPTKCPTHSAFIRPALLSHYFSALTNPIPYLDSLDQ